MLFPLALFAAYSPGPLPLLFQKTAQGRLPVHPTPALYSHGHHLSLSFYTAVLDFYHSLFELTIHYSASILAQRLECRRQTMEFRWSFSGVLVKL